MMKCEAESRTFSNAAKNSIGNHAMIDNIHIAGVLEQIADLLQIKGEIVFKVRAYRTAAEKIRGLGVALARISDPDKLTEYESIGQAIAEKIIEISQTGTCKVHQQLLAEIPASLLELLAIDGLGHKRVAQLHQQLGIVDAGQLQVAIASGKVENLPGFGRKLIEKIIKGLANLEKRKGRFTLDEVMPVAEELVALLRAIPGTKKVEVAGSMRRWKETAKDLDILVTGNKNKSPQVMKTFTGYHQVEEVIQQGDTKTSVKLRNGLQVDLRFVAPECFGASMQYFTGSKEHNIALRTLAKEHGFKTSEYGLFKLQDGQEHKVAGAEERRFYRALDMDYIDPELRENSGEIAAARRKELPRLLKLADIRGDLQMHTTQSDGKNSAQEMVAGAIAAGYQFIAITEHSKSVRVANGLDEDRLQRWIDELRQIAADYTDFYLLTGVEVDILKDGSLDLDEKVLRQCDVVVASIHSHFSMPQAEMTRRIVDGISHEVVNILAHPTTRLIHRRDPIDFDFDQVLAAAIKNQVALEVNSHPHRLDLPENLVRNVLAAQGKITVNSDAHSVEQLGLLRYGVHMARRGWCRKRDCINTFTVKQLRRFFAKK